MNTSNSTLTPNQCPGEGDFREDCLAVSPLKLATSTAQRPRDFCLFAPSPSNLVVEAIVTKVDTVPRAHSTAH